jgi:hypothetical protein
LRRIALKHTQFADASVTTTSRIHFAIASACPHQMEFEMAHLYLQQAYPPP